ncbi:hypothetical protein Sme01_50990 [Sphaerisporangium melleum]|uniref:DUF397 domain-containing protein n=1 Tax=Sphaerisporangium melleum TaxID=321316 RepID=A0A917VGM4_9ACTN|nr:DUF397 domain-containing protein [Sphaerisporangium melleum]GGK75381.1 hypothetical protein GCM10007964_17750 [Sphaerisporangium melleum]GII72623.1 hypothetical protein Sme01_50990 [Sphaerisporangium melleum]
MVDVTHQLAGTQWRKSSFSGGDGSNCVEVAHLPGSRYGVRDSKDRSRPALVVDRAEWSAFLNHMRAD